MIIIIISSSSNSSSSSSYPTGVRGIIVNYWKTSFIKKVPVFTALASKLNMGLINKG